MCVLRVSNSQTLFPHYSARYFECFILTLNVLFFPIFLKNSLLLSKLKENSLLSLFSICCDPSEYGWSCLSITSFFFFYYPFPVFQGSCEDYYLSVTSLSWGRKIILWVAWPWGTFTWGCIPRIALKTRIGARTEAKETDGSGSSGNFCSSPECTRLGSPHKTRPCVPRWINE